MKCEKCENIIPEEREELGYKTCVQHGDTRKQYNVGEAYNKGPLVLVTDKDLKERSTGAGKRR